MPASLRSEKIQAYFTTTFLNVEQMAQQHQQSAEVLFNLIPPALAPDFLEDYGLTVSREQAQSITWEVVLLSTYWIKCATQVGIPDEAGKEIWELVQTQVKQRWESRFGFVHVPIEQFFSEMGPKFSTWDSIAEQGGEPIAILTEAAADMESEGTIPRGEEQKLLVVLLDLVPIDEIGQTATEIEQGLSSDNLPF